ncbi:MAG: glycosyltransferase [Candidatus Omnitrophota bacterium]
MNKLNISVGICAYNEEGNIYYLLKSITEQKTEKVSVEEIVVVSDGCTDKTDEIVKNFFWHDKIKFIKQEKRVGKFQAVNEFLKHANQSVLVLASADIILDENAIEQLCLPFVSNEDIGMTGAQPIPINSIDSFLGYVVNLQWYLHHKLSLIQPKFGELIAFRNIVDRLPPTFVDEEQIASIIAGKGYQLKYCNRNIIMS